MNIMNKLKRITKTTLVTGLILLTSNAFAQNAGDVGLGLRGSTDGLGLNVKSYITDHFLFEGQVNAGGFDIRGKSVTAVALLEGSINLSDDPTWKLFLGGGGHAGLYDEEVAFTRNPARDDGAILVQEPEWVFGVDAIAGVEYFLPGYPMSISIDVKPAVNIDSKGDISFYPYNLVGVGLKAYIR